MPSLKDLRARIRSVKNTQQITKTMKMVAAAKVRRARNACEAAQPYAQRLNNVLGNLAAATSSGPLLLTGRDEVKTVRLIVLGADRGLCGGFNANLHRGTVTEIEKHLANGKKVEVFAVGRKARDSVRITHRDLLVGERTDVSKDIGFELAEEIALEALTDFEAGACDEVHILFMECVSMLTQLPRSQQLVPFAPSEEQLASTSTFEYEPSEGEILETLLPKNVKTQVLNAMLNSAASEQAARMTAMDNATRNAGEMIQNLTLEYNRSRQAAITKELIEIISGAEAL
ncbi:MAG: F0F1 ATP synthase subunit gamma [Alphaproteobacteria bacterium]|nr:F0F1 ATP synthase subunit gamma [Alphaproteobacteria bacterium]MDD9919140.1 F0F1 ATP synthase subunit gamma [Alphaproteobacteria bacterium]